MTLAVCLGKIRLNHWAGLNKLKRLRLVFFSLFLVMIACGQEVPEEPAALAQTAVSEVQAANPTTGVWLTQTSAAPTAIPTNTTLPTETPMASPTPITDDLALRPEDIILYPVPEIYAGDLVTIQVFPQVPEEIAAENVTVHFYVDGEEAASTKLHFGGLASRPQAIVEWVWQTDNVAGEHEVQVTLDQDDLIQVGDENPDNNTAVITAQVVSFSARPAKERNATWVIAENECCLIHVVSGTAAYRDLPELAIMVDNAVNEASRRLNLEQEDKLDIFLVDRVIGQGGYAGSGMVLSYLDRPYAGDGLYETLVHEAVHVLDRQIAPRRITILAEGTAVWATGGHYKPENLDYRVAALVTLNQYIPLAELADNFYPIQHEIGYLEAGGLVKYLVDSYGWSTYAEFYSAVTLENDVSPSAAMNSGFLTYYGKSLDSIEAEWLNYLATLKINEADISDLATTIRFYNVMRQYQLLYDPTAHFLTAWMPYPLHVVEHGNPADLTRHPTDEINITLEIMLQAADNAIRGKDYSRANILLDSVSRVLENGGSFMDPLATNYRNIVRKANEEGYQAQQINLNGSQAELTATKNNSTNLDTFRLMLQGQNWVFTN